MGSFSMGFTTKYIAPHDQNLTTLRRFYMTTTQFFYL